MNSIESLLDAYKNAVFQKDQDAFAAIFDGNVRVFDMWDRWSYEGLAAWRDMAKGWFGGMGTDRDAVSFDDVRVQTADDMAVLTAIVRFTAVSEKGEELRFLEERLTWVAKRKDGVWKIVHQHTSSPVDPATMGAVLQRGPSPLSSIR